MSVVEIYCIFDAVKGNKILSVAFEPSKSNKGYYSWCHKRSMGVCARLGWGSGPCYLLRISGAWLPLARWGTWGNSSACVPCWMSRSE